MSLYAVPTEDRGQRTQDSAVIRRPSSVLRFVPTVIGIGLILLALTGCQQPQRKPEKPTVVAQGLTIDDLARRLGLRVQERDESFVVLKNSGNTVLIFTQTNGRFFVNGKPVGSVGEVTRQGNTVYVSDNLVAQIRQYLQSPLPPTPTPRPGPPRARATVVIDAGHGGHDPGTLAAGSVQEKNINLSVATKVAALLAQQGVGVVMTRTGDQYPELEERAGIANHCNANLFVSIHADSSPNRTLQGFTVYVARAASKNAYQAAGDIAQAMTPVCADSHGIREADYKVLVNTSGPAVLIELGYLSNPQDTARLRDNAYQNRLAQAIAGGILNYVR